MESAPPTLQLRVARKGDAASLARCYLASRRTLAEMAPITRSQEEIERWVSEALIPGGGVLVAGESGSAVGFIAVANRVDGAWIDQLYVHPSRMRRGIGSTLLQVALMRLKGPVRLYTFEANRVARRFFEHYGFVAVAFGDGSSNEAGAPDVLYERQGGSSDD